MHFNVYDVFYSQFSHHVSAAIAAIFRVTFLLQEYTANHICTFVF